MLYLDTSALAKLVVHEAESATLRAWLADRSGTTIVTNVIGEVELRRVAARISLSAVQTATLLLARVDLLDLTPAAITVAGTLPPPGVRTLDALHIASAAELDDLDALLTYDDRMATAASAYGLTVASPGAAG